MRWYEELPHGKSWAALWTGYVICRSDCPGIRKIDTPCPACGSGPLNAAPKTIDVNGKKTVVSEAFAGAEGRYEDWIYLQMLQREWERPVTEFDRFSHFAATDRPSGRAALILLFWSYFETRIERLHRTAMRALPKRILDDELRRYSGIGSRLYDLYNIFFGTNYFEDLRTQGYPTVADLLRDIHERRNEFAHGRPQAINDATVSSLVENLKAEHEGWIAVFNRRVASI